MKRSELAQRQLMLTERFEGLARERKGTISRLTQQIVEKEQSLRNEIESEAIAREDSFQVLQSCISTELPVVE
jgi:hypothetical protein